MRRAALTAALFTALLTALAVAVPVAGAATAPLGYDDEVRQDNPIVYYRMADKGLPANATMRDSSDNGHPGLFSASGNVTQGVPSALSADPGDNAVRSTGADAVASGADSFLPLGNSARTLEAWYRSDSAVRQPVVAYGTSGVGAAFGLAVTEHELILDVYAGQVFFATERNIQDGQWHHLALTFDGTVVKAYLDGVEVPETSRDRDPPFGTVSGSLLVGGWVDTLLNQKLAGDVDEVAIYGSALSAARIAAHYAAGTALPSQEPTVIDIGVGCFGDTVNVSVGARGPAGSGSTITLYRSSGGSPFVSTGHRFSFVLPNDLTHFYTHDFDVSALPPAQYKAISSGGVESDNTITAPCAPGSEIPEASAALLLPISILGTFGIAAGVLYVRRRNAGHA